MSGGASSGAISQRASESRFIVSIQSRRPSSRRSASLPGSHSISGIPCILTVNVCASTTVGGMERSYFEQLHTSKDAASRALAASLTQDEALLRQLAGDEHDHVRIAVAGNPACPADALERLDRDPSLTARMRAMRGSSV